MDTAPLLPATEAADARFRDLDAWPPATALRALWETQLAAVAAVGSTLPAIEAAAVAAATRLADGGRLVYVGAGTSGRIATQDGAELPPTFDWPRDRLVLLMAGGSAAFTAAIENAEDDTAAGIAELAAKNIGRNDVVIGVAASGSTPFTCACVAEASGRGALTIAVANSPGGRLLALAAHPILVETGAEAIAGSTRLQAATAQKVTLNLFSTLLMVRLGRTYGGLMVDLRASNDKLRRRALRMLRDLTGAEPEAAEAALSKADGNVKTAVLVLNGLDPAVARARLLCCGGQLRVALAELEASRTHPPA